MFVYNLVYRDAFFRFYKNGFENGMELGRFIYEVQLIFTGDPLIDVFCIVGGFVGKFPTEHLKEDHTEDPHFRCLCIVFS